MPSRDTDNNHISFTWFLGCVQFRGTIYSWKTLNKFDKPSRTLIIQSFRQFRELGSLWFSYLYFPIFLQFIIEIFPGARHYYNHNFMIDIFHSISQLIVCFVVIDIITVDTAQVSCFHHMWNIHPYPLQRVHNLLSLLPQQGVPVPAFS